MRLYVGITTETSGSPTAIVLSVCAAASEAVPLRFAQRDESPCEFEFPRIGVTSCGVAPTGQVAQRRFAPGGYTVVLHGREATAQHGGEVLDPLTHRRRQPGRILVADVGDPAGLGPFLGCGRQGRTVGA